MVVTITPDKGGYPVTVSRRRGGGLLVQQSRSVLYLSAREALDLADVLDDLVSPTVTEGVTE